MPDPLAMFIPLEKADAVQRLVFGSFTERKDRAGETFDYETSKPLIKAWSDQQFEASGGKSYGNVRGQHNAKIAAGKMVSIEFDDLKKSVHFCAKIVDDNEWEKVEEGVYTGFSPGGSYVKRWTVGLEKRYTAGFKEMTICDVPCNPDAVFTLVKADGAEEEIHFLLAKAYEPGNEATKARADEMAKAVDGGDPKNFVVQARADLISENATEALAKMATAEPDAIEPVAEVTELAAGAKPDIDALLAKADAAIAGGAPAGEAPVDPFADLSKAAAALRLLQPAGDEMQKSLWQIGRLAELMESFQCIACNIVYEANNEKDGSPQPQMAQDAMKALGDLLITMAREEVAEAIAGLPEVETVIILAGDAPVMALCESIVDMVKADGDLMEKAGARNSKGDAAKLQSMHDNCVALGATCDAAAEKADLVADNERLNKAFGDTVPRIEALVETTTRLTAERDEALAKAAKLELLPAPPKGGILEVSKEEDGGGAPLAKSDTTDPLAAIAAMPNGMEKADAILRTVGTLRR
jgi:hypothetical protein